MHAMQYHVKLPSDYNMEIIRDRVRLNGYKTDGFKNLIIKAYLISQTTTNCITICIHHYIYGEVQRG